ncbi:MAG: FkbM family methyltransferase [Pseudomonadota bacterium]
MGIVISRTLSFVERIAAYLLGKGWGSATVEKEFASAISLLERERADLCIDIGGNKGTYAEQIVKRFSECKVVVFEPAASNVKTLKKKFADYPCVTIEQAAVSNEDGNATLYSDQDGSGLASLTKRRLDHFGIAFEYTESIQTLRFEAYWKTKLDSQHIDVCKIDIEGHELDALAGFGEAIKHVSVIQFEFGGCNIDTRTFFQDFWYFFQENEFDLYRISPLGLIHMPRYRELDEFFSTTNYLAKRRQ